MSDKNYKCAVCHDLACYKESCPNCGPVPKLADIQEKIDQEEITKLRDMLTIVSNLIGAAQGIIKEEIGSIPQGNNDTVFVLASVAQKRIDELRAQLTETQIAHGQSEVALTEAVEAMQEFIDRCERGEVRSRYTYGKFKDILQDQAAKAATERLNALIEAARIYHEQENPYTGHLQMIGKCKQCGCDIASISEGYCRKCAWAKLDAALKAYQVVKAVE
jgi:hypothetical protein